VVVRRWLLVACVPFWFSVATVACLAQGAATRLEIEGVAAIADVIGASKVIRGALERALGPAAKTLLEQPPRNLGLEVIRSDFLTSTIATSPALGETGKAEAFLASINDVRVNQLTLAKLHQLALEGPQQESVRPEPELNLWSIKKRWLPIARNPVKLAPIKEGGLASTSGSRAFSFSPEGIKIEPGYRLPIWAKKANSGNLVLETIKREDMTKAAALGCAVAPPCANEIATRLKDIFKEGPGDKPEVTPLHVQLPHVRFSDVGDLDHPMATDPP
jgi:hypothetical protein